MTISLVAGGTENNYIIASNYLLNYAQVFLASIENSITIAGTTAGSIIATQPIFLTNYKKSIIYLLGYENDTTTPQAYTFPVAFSTANIITFNNTSVAGMTLSLTEISFAPDTTTAYTGFIIIEGI
jgi:hypothetical protein